MRDPASQDPLPVSRRTVIGAAAASPLGLVEVVGPAQIQALSEGWLARRAESDRLSLRAARHLLAQQRQVDHLEKVAVDTHGHGHFGMTLAKVVGFDLTPRLARLKTRKLHLPTGFAGAVPEVLKPLIAPTPISRRLIGRGWEELLRLRASVKDGWYPATDALDRYGAAARGDAVYEAGAALGKLLLTLYLCDYLGNREFRNEILDLLNQGEAVHSLQRAIHNGAIPARQGGTTQQLEAISGALTLLANIVMTWNTHHIQRTADQDPSVFSNDILSHIAPIGHGHINLRGVMTFDLGHNRSTLLGLPMAAVAQG